MLASSEHREGGVRTGVLHCLAAMHDQTPERLDCKHLGCGRLRLIGFRENAGPVHHGIKVLHRQPDDGGADGQEVVLRQCNQGFLPLGQRLSILLPLAHRFVEAAKPERLAQPAPSELLHFVIWHAGWLGRRRLCYGLERRGRMRRVLSGSNLAASSGCNR